MRRRCDDEDALYPFAGPNYTIQVIDDTYRLARAGFRQPKPPKPQVNRKIEKLFKMTGKR